jgi:hypothetical protein
MTTATTSAIAALKKPMRPIFSPRIAHVFTLPRGSLLFDLAMVRPDMR